MRRDGDPSTLPPRFDRTARLLGEEAMLVLGRSTVAVMGMGGVGSYCAEGLARAGVGALRLVDSDVVNPTNFNRQLHALEGSVGQPKVAAMADRLRLINPALQVEAHHLLLDERSAAGLLAPRPDVVVDAIDLVRFKLHLIATCHAAGIPLVTSMGAAARLDPTRVRVADLAATRNDPLAADIRRALLKKHGIDCTRPTGITAVYSEERPLLQDRLPESLAPDERPTDGSYGSRKRIEGSVGFVTSVFGMTCAACAVRALLGPLAADLGFQFGGLTRPR